MAYDGTLSLTGIGAIGTLPSAATYAPTKTVALFQRGEGIALASGAIAAGLGAGFALFFIFGRVVPWAPFAVALGVYTFAMQLACSSLGDVIGTRSPKAIALFSLHLTALVAWPLAMMWAPASWQMWLGLPALLSLAAFLVLTRAPANAVYRSTAHISLIAAIAIYHGMWTGVGA